MRSAFFDTLREVADHDDRIWLLTGDLGHSVIESFVERYPERFVNMGVAEQNMAGVAAGLALTGKIVFIYSIANFPSMRCLEQTRNDICYHNLNVKIVSAGGGLAYGSAGYTHHAIEDLAIMCALPRMTVMAPADPVEVQQATRAITRWAGPCYLRLGRSGEPVLHHGDPNLQIGRAIVVRDGSDITLIAAGPLLRNVLDAWEILAGGGIRARVLSMPTIKPLDAGAVIQCATETHCLLCVEEHVSPGPVFGAVAAVLAQHRIECEVSSLNLGEGVIYVAHEHDRYLTIAGLDARSIADKSMNLLKLGKQKSS